MSRQKRIQDILRHHYEPEYLLVENESHGHRVPIDSETHFKVTIVSTHFESLSRLSRHRAINTALALELENGLHALSLHLYTPQEWGMKQGNIQNSPPCHHKTFEKKEDV